MTACGGGDNSVPVDDPGRNADEKPENGDKNSQDLITTDGGDDNSFPVDGTGSNTDEDGRGDLIDEGGRGDLIDEDDEYKAPYSGPDYDHINEADYSPLIGWWYLDGELSSLYYYRFTEDGQWYRFDRSPGVDAQETDSGVVLPDGSSTSFFYTESQSTGALQMLFLFDDDVITMEGDEGNETLIRME